MLKKRILIAILKVVGIIALIPVKQTVIAASASSSGHSHGRDDAKISDPSSRYINQAGKGPLVIIQVNLCKDTIMDLVPVLALSK